MMGRRGIFNSLFVFNMLYDIVDSLDCSNGSLTHLNASEHPRGFLSTPGFPFAPRTPWNADGSLITPE
ncbi:Hypothetical protein FKW44_002145 [Caligus rogercresseyi]|uniref:Uncharacterized protein n=1 Tax=Caligus rogercresseyi TaxID=217165 RepID=A0A7T8KJU2_CALRO|nr:Hypothetical protein FKW44_002145 [Caligus rogercresseyi]